MTSDETPSVPGTNAPGFPAGSPTPVSALPASPVRRRRRLIRWQGLVPLAVGLVLLVAFWLIFGEPIAETTVEEAATKALGTQVDIADFEIDELRTTVVMRGVAIAHPFDVNRNLLEAGAIRFELEPEPLLERKLIVKRLDLQNLRTGTTRATPARRVEGGGFAPAALREMERWADQFRVPLLSLTPIDTIRAIALDPSQLQTVSQAVALAQRTDSARQALTASYENLRIQQTLDSARALVARLQGANPRTLGIAGVNAAVSDIRRTAAGLDSARRRVETLAQGSRASVGLLESGVRSLDDARKADYAFARGLLKLPTFDAPEIGAALFGDVTIDKFQQTGDVTIDKFQQTVYWATLARQYAPPGLLPRRTPGPTRLRRAGTTVHFVERSALPRLLVRRADVSMAVDNGIGRGTYTLALSDATTEPALVGRPTLFALRRRTEGSDLESLLVTGNLDHVRDRPRDAITATASGVRLPSFQLPMLPLRADAGRGASELRVTLDGDQLAARWDLRSTTVAWAVDSTRARTLNTVETFVSRVITGLDELQLTAELAGPVRSPSLTVRSNLDREIAARMRTVVGEEVARAEQRVRAEVDRIVEEKSAPVRARIAELRSEGEQRVADARARLEAERAKLDEQVRMLTGGLVKLPPLPPLPAIPPS
jgi:uncharacterized protein (TIGR03545 family)